MTRRRRLALAVGGIVLLAVVVAAVLYVVGGGSGDRTAVQQSIAGAEERTDRLRTLSAAADDTLGQLATGGLLGLAVGAAVGGLVTYRYYDSQLT